MMQWDRSFDNRSGSVWRVMLPPGSTSTVFGTVVAETDPSGPALIFFPGLRALFSALARRR